MRKSSKLRIFTALCAAAVLAGCLTVLGVSADTTAVTDTLIEDFEDAAHVANWHQGIAGATMTQDTSVKHAGNASGRFENTTNNGLTGDGKNADVVNFDLSGFEKIRLYVKNPGDTDVALLFQIYLANYKETGSNPHLAIINVPAQSDFTAYDVVLADMTLKGAETTMADQPKESWKILEYDLAPASPGLYTLYVDDITAIAPADDTPVVRDSELVWDMEDKTLIDQLVTDPNIQTTEQKQSTEFKRSGNASLYWKNSKGNYGALGNLVAFANKDTTGYDRIRFYVYNPGDYPVLVQCQLAVKAFGTTAIYVAEAEVPAVNGFVPLDFALSAFDLKPGSTAGAQKLLGNTEDGARVIYDIGLVFNSRERDVLYLDDAMLITDAYAAEHEKDEIVPVRPDGGESSAPSGDSEPGSQPEPDSKPESKPESDDTPTSSAPAGSEESRVSPDTGVPGVGAAVIGLLLVSAAGVWTAGRKRKE